MRSIILPAAVLLCGGVALAGENLSCGNSIVTLPVSVEDLLRKCGEPARKTSTTEETRVGNQAGGGTRATGTTTIEKWTYQRSSQSLPMVVTIVDKQVTKIERAP